MVFTSFTDNIPELTNVNIKNDVISVSSLNRLARSLLESNLPSVLVEGEISNLATPASGHWVGARTDSGSQHARAWVRGAWGGPGLGGIRGPGSSWAAFGAGSWAFIYNTLRIV